MNKQRRREEKRGEKAMGESKPSDREGVVMRRRGGGGEEKV